MKEERYDAQYVREFYEITQKNSTLKVFYLRNKACLRLMKVNFDSECFEIMDYLGNVNVGIVKKKISYNRMHVHTPTVTILA